MPSRRSFLAGVGAAGLAGCVGKDTHTATTNSSPTGTTTYDFTTETEPDESTADLASVGETVTVDGADLTLSQVLTAGALPYVYTDSGGVQHNPGRRYVLAQVWTEADSPPARSEYSLVVAGALAGAADSAGSFWLSPNGDRYPYTPAEGPSASGSPGGWLAFSVAGELDAESPHINVGGTGWRLPDSVVARLRQPVAAYELVELDYPETIGPDEPFSITVTVENVGSVAGTFRAVLNTRIRYASYARPVAIELEPGEQGSWEVTFTAHEGLNDAGDTGAFVLRSPLGTDSGDIEVVEPTETATD